MKGDEIRKYGRKGKKRNGMEWNRGEEYNEGNEWN